MIDQKIFAIPFDVPFFDTYKECILKTWNPDYFQSAVFFVGHPTFKRLLIDFLQNHYPKEVVQTLKVYAFNETEDWQQQIQEPLRLFPPLKPLQRRHLMIELLLSFEKEFLSKNTPLQTWINLAEEILLFLDDVYCAHKEQDVFSHLENFVSAEVAHHWGLTLEYLQHVLQQWPLLLHQLQRCEPLLYHRAVFRQLMAQWDHFPPSFPIIALGIQETHPTVLNLLKNILKYPKSHIVLSNDAALFEKALWPPHPLYLCQELVKNLNLLPSDLTILKPSGLMGSPVVPWILHHSPSTEIDQRITLEEHSSFIEEVQSIGAIINHYYTHSEKRLALIAPPGDLTHCVKILLKKLNIPFGCSSAIALRKTILGQLSWLSLSIALSPHNPAHALAFWNFCRAYTLTPYTITAQESLVLGQLAAPLQQSFTYHSFHKVVQQHIQTLLDLFNHCTQQPQPLVWESAFKNFEGYETLTTIFENSALLSLPLKHPYEYQVILEQAFQIHLPCSALFKERVLILRPFESLFLTPDIAIIGDMNEGTWPFKNNEDMWLPPLLRKEWHLPDNKTTVSLEGQYFLYSCTAKEVILSRSLKNHTQTTHPSRWLLQLQIALKKNYFLEWKQPTTLQYLGTTYLDTTYLETQQDTFFLEDLKKFFDQYPTKILKTNHWQRAFSNQEQVPYQPCQAPRPCPPVTARPRRLSVTAIEQWMRDPYSIYARTILQLKPLEEDNMANSAAQRGIFIHQAIERWLKTTTFLSENGVDEESALKELLTIAQHLMATIADQPAFATAVWWPRFQHIARWFIKYFHQHKENLMTYFCEVKGQITLPHLSFTLTAEADRIDQRQNHADLYSQEHGWVIIDYKTGKIPSLSDVRLGFSPQLPLEALICSKDGFHLGAPPQLQRIEYWHLSGDILNPGKIIKVSEGLDELIKQTQEGLESLVKIFDNPHTPYLSCPRPDKAPQWRIYDHLARRQEWS